MGKFACANGAFPIFLFYLQLPIIRERRRFTDVMDEEIDDERRSRITRYGTDDSITVTRRLRNEVGTRLGSYAEAEALIECKREGQPPFFREKPQTIAIREGEPNQIICYAVGDPKPSVTWFRSRRRLPVCRSRILSGTRIGSRSTSLLASR